jgi:hypothetical protein
MISGTGAYTYVRNYDFCSMKTKRNESEPVQRHFFLAEAYRINMLRLRSIDKTKYL